MEENHINKYRESCDNGAISMGSVSYHFKKYNDSCTAVAYCISKLWSYASLYQAEGFLNILHLCLARVVKLALSDH